MKRTLLLRRFGVVAVMVVAGLAGSAAQDNGIVIQVLDGKNGKPIANEHLVIFTAASAEEIKQHKNHLEARTDAKGIATLALDTRASSQIQVWVDWHVLCQEGPNSNSYSVEDILKGGLTTPNNCGTVEQPVAPNHFVVFARSERLREKMRH